MSVLMHNLFNGHVGRDRARRIRQVLAKHTESGLVCNYSDGPRAPERGWFTAPQRGHPFDRDEAGLVRQVLTEADLWPPSGG